MVRDYDDDVGDVLKVQDRIATSLVRALQVTVGADDLQAQPRSRVPKPTIFTCAVGTRLTALTSPGLESAAGYFRQALELDPSFIRAAEWLANVQESLPEVGFVPPREGYELARASVERGLALNPRSGVLHSLMATITRSMLGTGPRRRRKVNARWLSTHATLRF